MAKFKVGDEVRIVNPHLIDRGRYGKIISVGVDGNPLLYDVDLGGGVQMFSESDLKLANSRACNSRNLVVAKAMNACARNANEPLMRYIQSNIKSKFPKSSLEGYTDGAVRVIERGNGDITILADRTARPSLDQIKAKFGPDYVFKYVDYGKGKTGFTLKPRAHAQRGEYKVPNACGTAKNASVGEDAALGISLSREALEKLKRAFPLIQKWIDSGKGHSSAVADGKRLVSGIKKAVDILTPVV